MTEESKGIPARTWSAISVGVFLLSLALGILLYMQTNDVFDAFWTILIVFGIYMAVSSVLRPNDTDNFGPSPADATIAGGVVLAGVGAAGLVYSFTGEVLYTAVVIIVVVAVVGMMLAIKNRNV